MNREKSGVYKVKYSNSIIFVFVFILFLIAIVFGIESIKNYSYTEIQFYLGFILALVAIGLSLLWKRVLCIFDENSRKITYTLWSIRKRKQVEVYDFDDVEKVTYYERTNYGSDGRNSTKTIQRVAELKLKNGDTRFIHLSQKSFSGFINISLSKNKTRRIADKIAEILGLEVDILSQSPSGALTDVFGKIRGTK